MSIVIEFVESPTDDARRLIEALETELSGSYAAEQRHGLSVERIFQPGVLFFIAKLDDEAVGCGGVALEKEFAELKRMYVQPAARGRGVAKMILRRLENECRNRGVKRMVLETGDVLHAAISLYEAAGFTRCAAFGAYREMPEAAIARSVFLEKPLA